MADGLNRRMHPRSLTDERAIVKSGDLEIACVVRDRSAGGARLVFKAGVVLPSQFVLQTRSLSHVAELIWSDGGQAGVRLHGAAAAGAK